MYMVVDLIYSIQITVCLALCILCTVKNYLTVRRSPSSLFV